MQQPPQQPIQPPQPKQGMSTALKVILILGGIFVLSIGSCVVCVGVGAHAVKEKKAEDQEQAAVARAKANKTDLPSLLSEYKDNEVRADQKFKGSWIELTGKVGDVKKGIVGDDIFVTIGTGAMFEIPVVQCFPDKDQASKAAQLSKGADVTVRGRVDGLLGNVLVKDCEIMN